MSCGVVFGVLLFAIITGCNQNDSPSATNPSMEWVVGCTTGESIPPGAGDIRTPPSTEFIFAGQSNMMGAGKTDELSYSGPIDNVLVWVNNHWETYLPGKCFGPDYQFAMNWRRDHPEEVVGIVKYAVGGTSMADWEPAWSSATADHPEYGSLYANLMARYNNSGSLPVRAVIWMQGESDAGNQTDAQHYPERLELFISTIRSATGANFIFGETATKDYPFWRQINDEQLIVSSWDGVKMTHALDLSTWEGTHLDTASQVALGGRLYNNSLSYQ